MIKLYSPTDEVELAFIKSLLDGEGIKYFVHNEHFGSLKVGPQIPLFNAKTIMVDEGDIERAKELVSDFIKNTQQEANMTTQGYSLINKIRLILEFFLFSWVMPGKKWHKKKPKEDKQ